MFIRRKPPEAVAALYRAIVEQSRQPVFYLTAGVPDTVMGRFDMIALHAALVLRRLQREPERTRLFGQQLFDHMFGDMDRSLREMGAGDLGVGKRVKALAQGFYGRARAYEAGLAAAPADRGPLQAALERNLYGTVSPSADCIGRMADYVMKVAGHLDRQPIDQLMAGRVEFDPEAARD